MYLIDDSVLCNFSFIFRFLFLQGILYPSVPRWRSLLLTYNLKYKVYTQTSLYNEMLIDIQRYKSVWLYVCLYVCIYVRMTYPYTHTYIIQYGRYILSSTPPSILNPQLLEFSFKIILISI